MRRTRAFRKSIAELLKTLAFSTAIGWQRLANDKYLLFFLFAKAQLYIAQLPEPPNQGFARSPCGLSSDFLSNVFYSYYLLLHGPTNDHMTNQSI